ncbi:MAG: hypothetical protein ACSLEM_03425 [Candidatus Malihini olakiniferum]
MLGVASTGVFSSNAIGSVKLLFALAAIVALLITINEVDVFTSVYQAAEIN